MVSLPTPQAGLGTILGEHRRSVNHGDGSSSPNSKLFPTNGLNNYESLDPSGHRSMELDVNPVRSTDRWVFGSWAV